ncbi:hypothetical protein CDL15_Pgr008880 [Punica granatum]|uniref:Uncharacterized protein n=1 Tax=Punica granatum TaxID=22663 RepID=A0A218VYZ3_PUNGR|nr:hypothetical protein CDL15_Pgr008880 [Punica granatum]
MLPQPFSLLHYSSSFSSPSTVHRPRTRHLLRPGEFPSNCPYLANRTWSRMPSPARKLRCQLGLNLSLWYEVKKLPFSCPTPYLFHCFLSFFACSNGEARFDYSGVVMAPRV